MQKKENPPYGENRLAQELYCGERRLLGVLATTDEPLSAELMKDEEMRECLRAIKLLYLKERKAKLKDEIIIVEKYDDKEKLRDCLKKHQAILNEIEALVKLEG